MLRSIGYRLRLAAGRVPDVPVQGPDSDAKFWSFEKSFEKSFENFLNKNITKIFKGLFKGPKLCIRIRTLGPDSGPCKNSV